MDLRSMLNPVGDASAAAAALKTPQRTVSLVYPPGQSPPIYPPPQRTSSLPVAQYRDPSVSVSPKTMPPPPPAPMATPSPTMSRKRSLSSDQQQTPQPAMKKRKYMSPPIWAIRESDAQSMPAPRRPSPAPPRPSPQPAAPPPPRASAPPPPPPARPRPSLEPSLDNHEPYQDLHRRISEWLWIHVIDQPDYGPNTHIEVEAKVGRLMDPSSQDRIALPIASEAIISPNGPRTQFQSLMNMVQHKRLNDYLNKAVATANQPGRQPMGYKHVRETDTFLDLPTSDLFHLDPKVREAHEMSGKGPRVRVTRDNKSNEIIATIIKLRLADIEVFCPNDVFDFRISVSLETAWPHPINHLKEHLDRGITQARSKDRLSYTHQGFQIDLTQVTPVSNQKEKVHELEIELQVDRLVHEAEKINKQVDNEYEKLIDVFLNNVRVLNRVAQDPPPPA